MAQVEVFVEGWTGAIDYTLKTEDPETGVRATFNAAGMTLALVLKDRNGTAVTTTGDATWADAAVSKARFTPDNTDLTASGSPYTARWQVTDGAGGVTFYPQGDALKWIVVAP